MGRREELLAMDLEAIPEKDPGKCDPAVYSRGGSFMMTHTIRMWMVEAFVKAVAEISGQKCDWHYVGGRANILVLGDREEAIGAAAELLPLLRRMWHHHIEQEKSRWKHLYSDQMEIALLNGRSIKLADPNV